MASPRVKLPVTGSLHNPVPDAPDGDGYTSEAARCRDLHRQLQVLWMEWHDDGLPQVTRTLAKREWDALWQPAYESFLRMALIWQNGSYVAATVHDGEDQGRREFERRHRPAAAGSSRRAG